jgi:hypothetical protein
MPTRILLPAITLAPGDRVDDGTLRGFIVRSAKLVRRADEQFIKIVHADGMIHRESPDDELTVLFGDDREAELRATTELRWCEDPPPLVLRHLRRLIAWRAGRLESAPCQARWMTRTYARELERKAFACYDKHARLVADERGWRRA